MSEKRNFTTKQKQKNTLDTPKYDGPASPPYQYYSMHHQSHTVTKTAVFFILASVKEILLSCTKVSFVWSNRSTAESNIQYLRRKCYLFANLAKLAEGPQLYLLLLATELQSHTQLILCKDSSVPLHRGMSLKNNKFFFHPSLQSRSSLQKSSGLAALAIKK